MSKKQKKGGVNSWKQIYRKIIYPRRKLLLLGLLLILINRLAGLVLPGSTKYLIDDIIGKGQHDMFSVFVLVVGIAILFQALTSFALTQLLSVQAQKLIAELRVKVQEHVIKLPISFFDSNKSGGLVSRIMTDVEGVRNIVGTGVVQFFGGIITAIGAFAALIYFNAELTLYILIPVIAFALISTAAFKRIRPIFRERNKIREFVNGRLTETLGGIRVVKGFNAENREISVFSEGVMKLFRNIRSSLLASSLVTSLGSFIAGIATLTIMYVGGNDIINNEMTTGELLAFSMYLGVMVFPIIQMGNIGTQLTEAIAGLDRTEELLSQPIEEDDPNRTIVLDEVTGHFEFNDVKFAYEEEKDVLHGISFSAPQGSVTALVGGSGSGKTTIASLVATFIKAQEGQITLDGHNLNNVNLNSYRKHLGVVLQDDFLFEGTIRENILFSNYNASDEEFENAVKGAYVNEFTDRFEEGLDTVIGERGVKLSGGQRQRVAIARAILANPKVLILDEATSNLDTLSEGFIQKSLETLMEGRTTFVIAHRLSTIKKANQILVVEDGRIIERGNHTELIEKHGRYFDMYTYQSRI
ncbi:MAG: ABC transporter ATP-binding protein [Bacteroidetes bacterium]|nr:ABC transporter ATP-binding protein [Bacteroidota bacterium]